MDEWYSNPETRTCGRCRYAIAVTKSWSCNGPVAYTSVEPSVVCCIAVDILKPGLSKEEVVFVEKDKRVGCASFEDMDQAPDTTCQTCKHNVKNNCVFFNPAIPITYVYPCDKCPCWVERSEGERE